MPHEVTAAPRRPRAVLAAVGVVGVVAVAGCSSSSATSASPRPDPSGPASATSASAVPTSSAATSSAGVPAPVSSVPPSDFVTSTATPRTGIPTAGLPPVAYGDCTDLGGFAASLDVDRQVAVTQYADAGRPTAAFLSNYPPTVADWAQEAGRVAAMADRLTAAGYPADHPFVVDLQQLATALGTGGQHGAANDTATFRSDYVAIQSATDQAVLDLGTYCATHP